MVYNNLVIDSLHHRCLPNLAVARKTSFTTRWHWVRDLVQNGKIIIESCRDPEQTADRLTKPLSRPKYQKHLNEMGLVTI